MASIRLTNLQGWFIITFLFWLLTLRSTVVFCALFFWLWITFLLLALSYILTPKMTGGTPNVKFKKAGAIFGFLAAFFAWYNALAGMADDSNRYVNYVPASSFFFRPLFLWGSGG
jgi:succinate-acetate transporter protein